MLRQESFKEMSVITKLRFSGCQKASWSQNKQQAPHPRFQRVSYCIKLNWSYAQYRHSFAGKQTLSSHFKLTSVRRFLQRPVSALACAAQRRQKVSLQLNYRLWRGLTPCKPFSKVQPPATDGPAHNPVHHRLTNEILGYIGETVKPKIAARRKRTARFTPPLTEDANIPQTTGKRRAFDGRTGIRGPRRDVENTAVSKDKDRPDKQRQKSRRRRSHRYCFGYRQSDCRRV
jgi:hypothetical protein